MMRFKSLILKNWKNFGHIEVELGIRNFFVGPNAAGKSNLLDVFRFLHDIVKVGGGFQQAVRDRGGVSKIRSLFARKESDILVQVSMEVDKDEWMYRIVFNQDTNRRPFLKEEIVWKNSEVLLQRPTEDDLQDPMQLTQTVLEQIVANKPFRPIADFFEKIRYLHIVPQLVREPERSVGKTGDPYGGDFLEQLAKCQQNVRNRRLSKIAQVLQVAVPQLKELKLERDPIKGTWHLYGLYEHWRPKAGWQSEEQFSDGTLRLIGLLWALLDGTGPLLLEEPELSLHADVAREFPQMIVRAQKDRNTRQYLISTHSRDVLDDPDIRADEVFMLIPDKEGTKIRAGKDEPVLVRILEGGGSVADYVLSKTAPANIERLSSHFK